MMKLPNRKRKKTLLLQRRRKLRKRKFVKSFVLLISLLKLRNKRPKSYDSKKLND